MNRAPLSAQPGQARAALAAVHPSRLPPDLISRAPRPRVVVRVRPDARRIVRAGYEAVAERLDISRAQVEIARRRVPRAVFVVGDAATTEFPAGSLDAVISETSLRLVLDARSEIVGQNVESPVEHGRDVPFLWILARKPPTQASDARRPGRVARRR